MDERQVLIDCWRLTEKHGRRPTIKGTMRMAREVGARFDEKMARALLRPFAEKSTPLAPRSHPDSTPQNGHVYPDSTPDAPLSERGSRARGYGTPSPVALETTVTSSPSVIKAERKKPTPKPLPELPAEVADDVERLIANDAALRADGKIGNGIVEEGLLRLRRAFEKNGIAALREGIDVALRKRKGLAYAAGCVRNRPAAAAPDLFGTAAPREVRPIRGQVPMHGEVPLE